MTAVIAAVIALQTGVVFSTGILANALCSAVVAVVFMAMNLVACRDALSGR